VRVGGSNSGHSAVTESGTYVLRQLPTAALLPDVKCVLGAGSYVDVELLLEEVERVDLAPNRLLIDRNAVVITEADKGWERESGLVRRIGSTGSGTGRAVAKRVERLSSDFLAHEHAALQQFVGETAAYLRELCDEQARIIVEGTQGFGLSVLHAPFYPNVTSRDTSAAGALSEAGLSPRDVDEVVLVIRAHPIRVGGQSGPLVNETTWDAIAEESGYDALAEYTSVTKKLRRVAEFDPSIVRRAIAVNNPSSIVLNHMDYIDADCRATKMLSAKAQGFLNWVESNIERRVDMVGTSPESVTAVSAAQATPA
jgi:adenylosuccinate synthase